MAAFAATVSSCPLVSIVGCLFVRCGLLCSRRRVAPARVVHCKGAAEGLAQGISVACSVWLVSCKGNKFCFVEQRLACQLFEFNIIRVKYLLFEHIWRRLGHQRGRRAAAFQCRWARWLPRRGRLWRGDVK